MKYDEAFKLATVASERENHIVYYSTKKLFKDILNIEKYLLQKPVCCGYLKRLGWDTRLS